MQLKDLIKSSGKKQKDIAKELNVGSSAISMWNSGKSSPKTLTIEKLAKILNVEPLQVLDAIKLTNKKRVVTQSRKQTNNSSD